METKIEKRMTISVIVGIIVFIASFVGFVVHDNEEKKVEQAINNGMYFKFKSNGTETIEYGSDIQPEDFVQEYDGKLTLPELNTKKIGVQNLTYSLNYGDIISEYEKKVVIQDTSMPEIKALKGTEFEIVKGESLPFSMEDFQGSDSVDGKLKVSIVGDVDVNQTGVYKLKAVAKDKNKNRVEKNITVKVKDSESKTAMDYSLGTELDAYQRVNANTIKVRDKEVFVENGVSQEIVDFYVKQFNLCPQFLLSSVDSFRILNDSSFLKLIENRDEVQGHFQYKEKNAVVSLKSQSEHDDVLIHECVHAFGKKYKVYQSKDFEKIFKSEKNKFDTRADKNISEYFAYTFTEYLMNGYDALAEKCPKTANYYKEMNL